MAWFIDGELGYPSWSRLAHVAAIEERCRKRASPTWRRSCNNRTFFRYFISCHSCCQSPLKKILFVFVFVVLEQFEIVLQVDIRSSLASTTASAWGVDAKLPLFIRLSISDQYTDAMSPPSVELYQRDEKREKVGFRLKFQLENILKPMIQLTWPKYINASADLYIETDKMPPSCGKLDADWVLLMKEDDKQKSTSSSSSAAAQSKSGQISTPQSKSEDVIW